MAEYIEREELLKKLQERDLCLCVSEADIEGLPAADVAPVVHGRWISKDYMIPTAWCSVCGSEVQTDDYGEASSYCPWCGAKMDKEDADA